MTQKWKDHRGETLVEVLASILIGALSVALLFTAVMASANMDRSAKSVDGTFSTALSGAEKQETPVNDENIVPAGAKVTVRNSADPDIETSKAAPDVTFYGGEGAISYALAVPPNPGGGDTP